MAPKSFCRWHHHQTNVLSCQHERMVPATIAHRKDLIKNIEDLQPGGTSELEYGFLEQMSFIRVFCWLICVDIVSLTCNKDHLLEGDHLAKERVKLNVYLMMFNLLKNVCVKSDCFIFGNSFCLYATFQIHDKLQSLLLKNKF